MERALCPVLGGREDELSELEDALLSANRGEGQVILLAGDAGMGKTRLSIELMRRARKLGMTVVLGRCSQADLALPYLPFLEAIGNHLAAADLDEVRRKLGPVRRELAHLFPQLEPEGVPVDATDDTYQRVIDWLREHSYEAKAEVVELKGFEHPVTARRIGQRAVV